MREVRGARKRCRQSVWDLPFRPFFLGGTAFAAVMVPLWVAFLQGRAGSAVPAGLNPLVWHGHEMVFGFVLAIVVGFLGTASANWSGQRGLHGMPLTVLVAVWLIGRAAFAVPALSPTWRAVLDLPWLPLAAWCLFPHLRASGRRNWVFLALLLVFFAANVAIHLELLGRAADVARPALYLAVYLVVIMVALISGRVVPFFIAKALDAAEQRRPPRGLEVAAIVGLVAVAACATVDWHSPAAAVLAFVVAALHAWRLVSWHRPGALGNPMLVILLVGCGWIVVALVFTGFALIDRVPPWLALHAFTAGVIGVMIYGMVPRISLGHTGRRIAADGWLVAGFALINAAAVARVFVPLAGDQVYVSALTASATLWSLAYGLLFVRLAPALWNPRVG